ncbi:hypothetical protein [Paenibacillus sp. HB172176]|uniref:hypothetical protein n=1 Tax=Paenibacillus sp. HB172176 TaxID=2493690 RepID=UPI00143C2CBD|nr:hypothetical protein [Paenibacillus sp. HB172176]
MKIKNKRRASIMIVAIVGLTAIITSASTVMGDPFHSAPIQDEGHVGLTLSEQGAISLLPKLPPTEKPLDPEKQAMLDNEFKMRELAKDKVLYLSKDENDNAYWSVEAITGLTFELQNVLDVPRKVGQIKFTGLEQVRVDISYNDVSLLQNDLITASQLIFKQVPEINYIEYLVYRVDSDYNESNSEGAITTTRSDFAELKVDPTDKDVGSEAFNKVFDVSLFSDISNP